MGYRTCLAGVAAGVLCGTAHADDLATIYREALANNAQYQSAEAQYASVRERVPESVAGLLPAVSVSANTTYNDNDSNTLSRQQYNSDGYTVTLVQPVWRWQNALTLSQAHSLVDQAKAQLELARQGLVVKTAQAYFDVLYARDALTALNEQKSAYTEQIQQAERSFEVGGAAVTDVRDAKARFDLVNAQAIGAETDLASKSQALREIIHADPGTLAPLRPGVALARPVPDSLGPWEAAAGSNNAAVIAAEAGLDVAELELRKARAGRLPTVDLVATHGVTKSATNITVGTDLHADTVGLQLSVPIYAGGGTSAKIREQAALASKATADLEDTRRSSVLAAQQSYLAATSGVAQVAALEDAVASARVAVESNRRGLQLGSRITLDVLNAEQQLSVAERDLAKARYDTLVALLRLKAAAGSLGMADIEQINALLVK